ncbi:transposase [Dactylosporangium darangshiense]|uniref:Transposase DDE domain-containing protein n=1 Tax=Dactylosporangium darangshiense TaxID=579108 RepID=A0ABP8DVB7_9ACTN
MPLLSDRTAQAKAGTGYDKTALAIDWDNQSATCPQGKPSVSWNPCRQAGRDRIVVSFAASDCRPCPARAQCTRSAQGRRHVSLLTDAVESLRREHRAGYEPERTRQKIYDAVHKAGSCGRASAGYADGFEADSASRRGTS